MKASAPAAPRYLCIHGHFYQPPRENPWLESIEREDSAYPYHDWNARIDAECYAQNAASRRLDETKSITRIVNNYARISFNIGPTLLAWMEKQAPDTYRAIIEADVKSARRYGGHGSAIAQGYSHMILPLANARDKATQIGWGTYDFEHRFKRAPEGIWLPETAVDLETLELCATRQIRFTILAPRQAARVRPIGTSEWIDVSGGRIDPSRAYLQRLPSGQHIAIFFYDGPVSQGVAFERLLNSGEGFAGRLLSGLSEKRTWPQLMHIATDGESYGHHHRHGDMALSHALSTIRKHSNVELTCYGEFLEKHPPTYEVEIFEDTSWSCAHGIERWREDCGCSGGRPGWNQRWRKPLREALDGLRDALATRFETRGAALLRDPWAARDAYIRVILDRDKANVDAFLDEHAAGERSEESDERRLQLLEMQRHAMLMYTSCGFFFDDISGIETVQVMMYAARAAQLGQIVFGDDFETPLIGRLEAAKSNIDALGTGRAIYEKQIEPLELDLVRVGAHYAVSSLFSDYPDEAELHCYRAESLAREVLRSGRLRLGMGRAIVTSKITRESATVSYAALHFGDHNVACGVRDFIGKEAFEAVRVELDAAFSRSDVPEVIRLIDRHFGDQTFSMRSLFRDEQRRLMGLLLARPLEKAGAAYRGVYDENAPVMRFLAELGMPTPTGLQVAAERALNDELSALFGEVSLDRGRAAKLFTEARERAIALDTTTLEYAFRRRFERVAEAFVVAATDLQALSEMETTAAAVASLPFSVDLWKVQNLFNRVLLGPLGEQRARAEAGDALARAWVTRVTALGESLQIRVE